MKTRLFITITLALASLIALPEAVAQRNSSGSARNSGGRTSQTSRNSASPRQNARQAQGSSRSSQSARPAGNATRPTQTTRPTNSAATSRPGNVSTSRPTQTTRPSHAVTARPGSAATVRPSNNASAVRPGQSARPSNGSMSRPMPGHNSGSSVSRPSGIAGNGGHSAPRPGSAYRPGPRPNYNYCRPNYRPPRPGGGYWGAPPVNIYRPVYYLPPRPPRPVYVTYNVPTIGSVLGLAFGSFIDAGINTLFNNGYNVLGYVNNAVYLGNVRQLGYIWPETTVYYTDGLMSNAQFQYWSQAPDVVRFNNVYSELVSVYGAPVSSNTINGVTTVSWWGGNNTGYVTLQYGPGASTTGLTNYYTTLTYSDGYDY